MNGQNNNSSNQVKPDIFSDRDSAAPLTRSEEQAFRAILAEEDSERLYSEHVDAAHRKMWLHFQTAASSLTQLYRDRDSASDRHGNPSRHRNLGVNGPPERSNSDSMWVPFQTAAGNLTQLYRESLDNVLHSGGSLARKSGYQRARKELLAWARSKRRCIPRDELLAILASMNMSASSDMSSSLQSTQHTTQNTGSQNQPLLGVEELLQAATFNENGSHNQHNYSSVGSLNGATSTTGSITSFTPSLIVSSGPGATAASLCSGHNTHPSNVIPRQGVKRPLPPPSPPPHFNYSPEDRSLEDQLHPLQSMQSFSEFSSTTPVSDCFAAAASLANVTDSVPPPDSSNNNESSNNRDVQMEHYFSPVLKKPRT